MSMTGRRAAQEGHSEMWEVTSLDRLNAEQFFKEFRKPDGHNERADGGCQQRKAVPQEQNRNSNLQSSVSRMEIPLGGLQTADSMAGPQRLQRARSECAKPQSHGLNPHH